MPYDWQDYEREMDAYRDRLLGRGVSVGHYGGYAVVEAPHVLDFDAMLVFPAEKCVFVGEAAHLMYRIRLREQRQAAFDRLELLLDRLAETYGVDRSLTSE